mmetsp:Transcript_42127/g.47942  ORF Transcript_42127/g.47942 Transcript_42127/m.47942 type:complete len:314 (-) Transcript_42127:34-975(-)
MVFTLLYFYLSQEENSSSSRDGLSNVKDQRSALLHQWFGSRNWCFCCGDSNWCFGCGGSNCYRHFGCSGSFSCRRIFSIVGYCIGYIGFQRITIDIVFVKMTKSVRIGLTQVDILPPFCVGITLHIHFGIRDTVPIFRNCCIGIFGTIQHTLVVDCGCCIEATATVIVVRNITHVLSLLVLVVVGRIIVIIIMAVPLRVGFTSVNIFPPFGIRLTRTIIASLHIGNTQTAGRNCSVGISGTINDTLVCYYSCCIQASAAIVGTSYSRADIFALFIATNHHNEEWHHHHCHHHDSITKKSHHFVCSILVFFSRY